MSDHDSDADNTPPKAHKPRKSKYVDASEVKEERKKVKVSKKKKEREASDDEDDEPPAKHMSDEEPEEEEEKEEAPEPRESLLESGDDMEDEMIAAMEKQERKALKKKQKAAAKKEEQPSKKQKVEAKSKASTPPPSDSESEEEKKEPPSYDAFAKKKKQTQNQSPEKKKKRKHEVSDSEKDDDDAQTKREDEEQRSDMSDSDSDDEPAAAAAASSSAKKFPFDSNPMDPNFTGRKWSEKHSLNVHYSQLVPVDNFTVKQAPDKYKKAYFTFECNKEQKFDFSAGTDFKKIPFGKATVMGPFARARYPRMWPYGDRLPLKYSKYPPPKFNSGIRFKLPLYNNGFANPLKQEKKGVGLVDQSADHFMQNWCRLFFDKWTKEQSWKWSQKMFPVRRKELFNQIDEPYKIAEAAYNNSQQEWDSYEEALKTYEKDLRAWGKVKKNSDPKPEKPEKPEAPRIKKKPNVSDSKKESELRNLFMRQGVKSIVLPSEKDKFEHVNFTAPLLRNLTKDEQDGNPEKGIKKLVPNLPNDKFFIDAFKSPPMYQKQGSDKLEPGYPLVPVDLPMFRCVTAEEAIHDKKRGYNNLSPYRLIPREHRFIVSDDVLAPVFQLDTMDSKTGSGFCFELVAVIWLGESEGLRTDQQPLPWKPAVFKDGQLVEKAEGYDPSTYFCIAQPYMRRKGKFDPETVENSKYQSARTNDDQTVKYDPAADDLYGGYD